MRPIDADELMEQYNLKDATKYGNKDAKQQKHSYSTLFLYELADMIEDAPTIDISGKWIPCSERLPDSGVDVNITTRSSIVGVGSFFEETNEWVQWYCGGGIVVDVIAWQPLPEPYKGE